jgi:hypothetical protein
LFTSEILILGTSDLSNYFGTPMSSGETIFDQLIAAGRSRSRTNSNSARDFQVNGILSWLCLLYMHFFNLLFFFLSAIQHSTKGGIKLPKQYPLSSWQCLEYVKFYDLNQDSCIRANQKGLIWPYLSGAYYSYFCVILDPDLSFKQRCGYKRFRQGSGSLDQFSKTTGSGSNSGSGSNLKHLGYNKDLF